MVNCKNQSQKKEKKNYYFGIRYKNRLVFGDVTSAHDTYSIARVHKVKRSNQKKKKLKKKNNICS